MQQKKNLLKRNFVLCGRIKKSMYICNREKGISTYRIHAAGA